jgi:hypothetical protein
MNFATTIQFRLMFFKMRKLSPFVILGCSLTLVSCARHELPPIKNAEALRHDCAILFQQFPVSEISTNVLGYDYQHSLGFCYVPKSNWSASISALHPYLVCSYQGGIQIWIDCVRLQDQGKYWHGYYVIVKPEVPPPPQAASNHFVFKPTDLDGILLLKQTGF